MPCTTRARTPTRHRTPACAHDFFLCHTAPGATLAALVTAAGQRWMVEESFQVAKGQVGLDEHEVHKWCSWYRHTTVCMLAMAFLTTVRSRHTPARPTLAPDRG
ncbi:hypothetical protein [Streptomyces sp.]|uniref:hypothetical protein n=1 Tax=Streptomyces sp. TaxID=1931 RepID=UPI00281106C2|nr:hypothetical protein [Streptomyces sp.]